MDDDTLASCLLLLCSSIYNFFSSRFAIFKSRNSDLLYWLIHVGSQKAILWLRGYFQVVVQ